MPAAMRQSHSFEQLLRVGNVRPTGDPHRNEQILQNRKTTQQRVMLKHDPYALPTPTVPLPLREIRHILAIELVATPMGLKETRQEIDESTLTAARATLKKSLRPFGQLDLRKVENGLVLATENQVSQ